MSNTMEQLKMRVVYALINKLGLQEQKNALVASFSATNNASLTDMSNQEANLLIAHLQGEEKRANDPMRRKIIHQLCLLGYTKPNTQSPDYERIDQFLKERCGNKNPKKHKLNQLTHSELIAVLGIIGARVKKEVR
jgi:hypothetical protein